MIVYELKLQSQPKVEFACSVTTENYHNIIDKRADMIEISVLEGVPVQHQLREGTYVQQPGAVFVAFPDLYVKSEPVALGKITFNTVAMRVQKMQYTRHTGESIEEIAEIIRRNNEKDTIFLPFLMELGDKSIQVISLIKSLTSNYLKNTTIGTLQCLSKWYELLAFISEEFVGSVLQDTENTKSVASFYTYKARKYLAAHYAQKVYVGDLAKMLNISPDYLGRIFKKDTGMSVRTYLNMLRVQHARQLVYDANMSLQQIADAVGICDVRYMQRLFTKFYGISILACNRIDHEISLYHEKPWEIENLSDDSYVTDTE